MPSSPTNILLVTGGGWHDFENGGRIIRETLEATGQFVVTHTRLSALGVPEFATLPQTNFRAVVLYTQNNTAFPPDQEEGLIRFVENGGGLVGIHCAADTFNKNERLTKLLGCQFLTHPPGVFDFTVRFTEAAKPANPMALRSDDFVINDEHYVLTQHSDFDVFAVSHYQGKDVPMGYTRRQGKGTVVYLANGHHSRSLNNRYFQRLLDRAVRVASGEAFDTQRKVRCAMLGYGGAFNMGKYHSDSINAQPGMETVAVCDLDPKRTAQAKAELGEKIRTYNKMDELLADDGVDLVVVILPHNAHATACIAASKAGKHVITEKPFCITVEEADAMIAASRETGKVLSVFHNRRWDGDFLRIFELIRAGEIGQVYHIEAATGHYGMPGTWWRASKEISGGVMYDWGAHYCDWLLNLTNQRIESVSGNFQKRYWHQSTNEDFGQATIRFADGTTATLEQGTLAAIPRPGWRILGTKGGITNAGPHAEITLVQFQDNVRRETKISGGPMNARNFYQNIGNHLLMGERLIVTAEQARRAIGVIRTAELSSQQGGKPLPLAGEDTFTPDYIVPW
jgi:scyllo-inositol 2-dehydrogenase (NADP+)